MKRHGSRAVFGLSFLFISVTAVAGPGDGSAVIVDRLEAPDLIIQDVREENFDATHAPIKVRIGTPDASARDDALKSARITVWLTTSLSDTNAERLSEVTVTVGRQWEDRSLIIHVPSPGEGEYFVHVEGDLSFESKAPVKIVSLTTQKVRFGQPKVCRDVEVVAIPGAKECPVRFDTGSVDISRGSSSAANEQLLAKAAGIITELCESNSLHRVSVRGWASTRHSVNPTNEELARDRSAAVVESLQRRVASQCRAHVHSDSVPGTRGVTTQFGGQDDNQCAQIMITGHTCKSPSAP